MVNIAIFLIGLTPFSLINDSTITFKIPVKFISYTGKTMLFTTSAHLKDYQAGTYHINNSYIGEIIIEKHKKSVMYYISVIAESGIKRAIYKDHSVYFSKMPKLPKFTLKCTGIRGSELRTLLSKAGIRHVKIPDKDAKFDIPAGTYTERSLGKLMDNLNNSKN